MNKLSLGIDIAGVSFKNPVIAASGTFGFGLEYEDFIDINMIGGVAVKGLTYRPRKGNPPPRIAETPSGILNSVGLQNPGIDRFIDDILPRLKKCNIRIIANINGSTVEEYCSIAERLKEQPVDFLELNVSCPNVRQGGAAFGVDPEMVYQVTQSVRKSCNHPMMVKLTPNTSDIRETALAAQEAGADAVSLINTLLGMAIDVKRRKPVLANITGGLSGPAIKPIALRMVWEVSQVVKIPVVGMGGIMSGEDAVEFLLAGATAVSVGTANLVSPNKILDIVREIEEYMKDNNIADIKQLIGGLVFDNRSGGWEV